MNNNFIINSWTCLQHEKPFYDFFKNVKIEDLKFLTGPVTFHWN